MNAPLTITATVPAWLPFHEDMNRFVDAVKKQDHQRSAGMLHFYPGDMSKGERPWVRVGTADVTVTLIPTDGLAGEQIKALQAELARVRAESVQEQNVILDRIGKLQAIAFDDSRTVDA